MVQPMTDDKAVLNPAGKSWLQVLGSRHFTAWLGEQQVSLAFTKYQEGKLLFVGRNADHTLSVFERTLHPRTDPVATTKNVSLGRGVSKAEPESCLIIAPLVL